MVMIVELTPDEQAQACSAIAAFANHCEHEGHHVQAEILRSARAKIMNTFPDPTNTCEHLP